MVMRKIKGIEKSKELNALAGCMQNVTTCSPIAWFRLYVVIHPMDITTAYINGELAEEVYISQPEGFLSFGNGGLVCELKHSLYQG